MNNTGNNPRPPGGGAVAPGGSFSSSSWRRGHGQKGDGGGMCCMSSRGRPFPLRSPSRVFPLSAASRFSPKARLFASAASAATAGGGGGGEGSSSTTTSDPPGSSECRSRVKVWEEATSGGVCPEPKTLNNNSCLPATSAIPEYDGTAAGSGPRAQVGQHRRAGEVEWSRQFLGHSINAVLFAPTSQQQQRTKQATHSTSAMHGDDPVGDGRSHEKSEEDDHQKRTVLLIGTDKGMVAAADVSGGSGSKLLYAVYLGGAPHGEGRGGGGGGNLARLSISSKIIAGSHGSNNAGLTPLMAAAASMGTTHTSLPAVYDLQTLPGRSDAVLALVGCVEGSTIYLLNVEDGSVLQEDALSKSYTLMATPSRLLPVPSHNAGGGVGKETVFHTQLLQHQLALLGCGIARKVVDRDTELDQSTRSGVLFLFDVPQRKQWLKLTGASSDCCCSLALQDNLQFAAACFSSGIRHQQQTQLLIWKLPSRAQPQSSEKGGATAKRRKLPPAMMTHFFESLVQLLLPASRSKSVAETIQTSNEVIAGDSHVEGDNRMHRHPVQVLIGLSRSSIIAIWGCFSTMNADSQGSSFTLELLLQIDTTTPSCSLSSSKAFISARPGLGVVAAAAAVTPGVWYIEEGKGCDWCWDEHPALRNSDVQAEGNDETGTRRASGDQSTACTQKEFILRVVRGSYAAPLFACVAIPSFSDGSAFPTDQLLYLPLLFSSNGKTSHATDNVVRPLSAWEFKQAIRKESNQEEDMGDEEGSGNQEGIVVNDIARELPTACLKRKIGAAYNSNSSSSSNNNNEGQTMSEVSGSGREGQSKLRKAAGFPVKENAGGAVVGKSNVASILRQALVASDARLLESVLSSTAKDKKEVAAAVASLTTARALLLLQHLVQQQQTSPATSILKGPWIEELVKQHGVILGATEAGREQLVLLLLQVEERRRTEAALVRVKGRVELLLQQMHRIQEVKNQRRKDEIEVREPLVVHREQAR